VEVGGVVVAVYVDGFDAGDAFEERREVFVVFLGEARVAVDGVGDGLVVAVDDEFFDVVLGG